MPEKLKARHVFIGLLVVLIGVILVVVVRTVRLSHDMPGITPVEKHDFDADAATDRLSEAIRFRTVSNGDASRFDVEEFEGFIAFMQESYPLIHERADRWRIGDYTLLFRWEGRNPDLLPGMLMGHYDVVPVEPDTRETWRYPPYSGMIAEGFVWGRGAFDDKSGTLSIFEAIEYLMSTGFVPERTMYFAANHDEEVGGLEGAARVAEWLESRDVELAFLIDEGMPIVEEILSGIESPLALIGVAEKGNLNVELSITNAGGHSAMPPRQTSIGDMSAAIGRLKDNPMPGRFSDLIQSSFEPISPGLPFVYRMGLANLWLFRPLIESRLSRHPHTNAALRTTVAPTIFEAGVKTNVLPAHARAVVNFRIHPNDDVASVLGYVESTISNPQVEIRVLDGTREASGVSDVRAESFEQVKQSIWEVFDEVPIAPSMFPAATDSRHFRGLTDNIYRFRAIRVRPEDRDRLHGTNERLSVANYAEMIQFQIRLLLNTTS